MIFPDKLKVGDTVGLMASCSHQNHDQLHLVSEAVAFLESWGLKVRLQPGYDHKHFYLAGTDRHRAEHFQSFYTDPQIKALFFTRGGYGASRLFRYLDDSLMAKSQKIVVGLSDVTSLLLYLQKVCGMVVFHGPTLATTSFLESSRKAKTQESLYNHLFLSDYFPAFSLSTLKEGYGKGLFVGGNLSLIVTTLGTPYEIDTTGKVLFIEEVNEKPYRVDRMLTHLRNAGKLDKLQGIIFGDMVGCYGENNLLWNVIEDLFQKDSFPILYGLPSGHGPYRLTLPLGVEVEVEDKQLRFLSSSDES